MTTLRLENISKTFGKLEAVKGLSLTIKPGTMYGFLGPNGAGKTTTLRMIMEIILPDSGEIFILDQPNSLDLRNRVGYLPEERGLYRRMKVHDALAFFAELKGLRRRDYTAKIDLWLERFGMASARDQKMEELSKGNQQKIQFITAILHEPDLIVVDEPFMGLDPINVELVKNIMLEQKNRGASILFSTHQMEHAEKLCDNICLIDHGLKLLDGDLPTIKKQFGKRSVILSCNGNSDYLNESSLIRSFHDFGQYFEVTLNDGVDYRTFLQRVLEHTEVSRFEVAEPSLNEIFLSVVKPAASRAGGQS